MNRIQKLLFSEYCDFEDVVLLESPFAETTREGKGIRQIQLGLTPTKVIIAEDFLNSEIKIESSKETLFSLNNFQVPPELDPDIETLELVSVIPVECVNFSIFHRRKKHTLKARFCNGQVLYFELGGFCNRKMLWNLWSEKVKFLSPEENGSSASEASAATSSTCSTLYLMKSRSGVTSSGVHQIWNLYGKGTDVLPTPTKALGGRESTSYKTSRQRWTDRNLFPTELDEEGGMPQIEKLLSFKILESENLIKDIMVEEPEQESCETSSYCSHPQWSLCSEVEMNPISMEERREDPIEEMAMENESKMKKASNIPSLVNRFGRDVNENCGVGLYLYPLKASRWETRDSELNLHNTKNQSSLEDFISLMDIGVKIWESGINLCGNGRQRHLRRYGLTPCPNFYRGILWRSLSKGDQHSVQSRQVVSCIELNNIASPDVSLPLPKDHLLATVSCEALVLSEESSNEKENYEELLSKYPPPPLPSSPIFFWTTDQSYGAQPVQEKYLMQQCILKKVHQHLSSLYEDDDMEYHRHSSEFSEDFIGYSSSSVNDVSSVSGTAEVKSEDLVFSVAFPLISDMDDTEGLRKGKNTNNQNIRPKKQHNGEFIDCGNIMEMSALRKVKRLFQLHIKLTAWDFNSATLANQLTVIDRDLFLQIPVSELGILVHWRLYLLEKCFLYCVTSWHSGAPCFGAFAAFSHRIACLVSSEVIKGETAKVRARLIARFINAANKCYQLQNFQSCQSILNGLQSPAIYRLRKTWNHLRLQHANKYETFEYLCKFFKDPRFYGHNVLSKNLKGVPYIPSIHFLISHLLGIIPNESVPIDSAFRKIMDQKCKDYDSERILKSTNVAAGGCEQKEISINVGINGIAKCGSRLRLLQRLKSSFRTWPLPKRHKSTSPSQVRETNSCSLSSVSSCQHVKMLKDMSTKVHSTYWLSKNTPELLEYFHPMDKNLITNQSDKMNKSLVNAMNTRTHGTAKCNYCSYAIDDYRMELINRAAEILLSSQCAASHYALSQSDLAREYLLKAKYKEHLDNYFLSFQIEST